MNTSYMPSRLEFTKVEWVEDYQCNVAFLHDPSGGPRGHCVEVLESPDATNDVEAFAEEIAGRYNEEAYWQKKYHALQAELRQLKRILAKIGEGL